MDYRPISREQAVDYAAQIVEGSAAHEKASYTGT
jgi:hypothetical protein